MNEFVHFFSFVAMQKKRNEPKKRKHAAVFGKLRLLFATLGVDLCSLWCCAHTRMDEPKRKLDCAKFPLPQGEGQGEGSPDKYHMNLTKRKLDGVKYGERVRSTIASLKVSDSDRVSDKASFNDARLQGTLSYCFNKLYLRCTVLVSRIKGFETIARRRAFSVVEKPFVRRTAFTMAEVLIVLGILGLVADMTIPTLITKVNDKALQTAKTVANLKFEEALNQMRANDKLTGYDTAESFANEFTRYMKTVQRCTSDNITSCFPMIIKTDDEEIDPATLTTGAKIVPPAKKANFPSNNVGITIPNGIMAILNYDKTCAWMNPLTGGSSNRQEAMTCISMVYDVNGRKKPNKVGEDIILLNAQLSSCDGVKLGSLCVEGSNTPYTPINTCDGTSKWDPKYISTLDYRCTTNSWAGAKKACSDKNMRLPTMAELTAMASKTYNVTCGRDCGSDKVADSSLNMAPAEGGNRNFYWASDEPYDSSVYFRSFYNSGSSQLLNGKYETHQARCVK